jgi:hypothetical protein
MKTETKYTPGWTVNEGTENIYIETGDRMTVACVPLFPESASLGLCSQTRLKNHQRNRQSKANARLIAAAPELLKALRMVITTQGHEINSAVLDEALAAIAKAEGKELQVAR